MGQSEKLYIDSYNKKPTGNSYYLISIRPCTENITYASFYSVWDNEYHEGKYEKRKIDTIDPEQTIYGFKRANQGIAVIESSIELKNFLKLGGHGLVEEDMMKKHWQEIIKPKIVINTHDKGYIDYEMVELPFRQRFLKGQKRMEIFERDNYQCRICGSSQDDNIHVRLEVHHIKSWEEGGLSELENLITLCKTCHEGIGITNRNFLYKKIGVRFPYQNHKIYFDFNSIFFSQVIPNSVTFKIDKRRITARTRLQHK